MLSALEARLRFTQAGGGKRPIEPYPLRIIHAWDNQRPRLRHNLVIRHISSIVSTRNCLSLVIVCSHSFALQHSVRAM